MEKGGNGDGVSHSDDSGTDPDPEVTAITRRFNRTGNTLGAIDELEQLLIERTGQIPVISPELLAAHAARIEHPELRANQNPTAIASGPARQTEFKQASPRGNTAQAVADSAVSLEVDWTITAPVPLDPAPGFSSWVDPDAIARAFDATPRDLADVSTKVFAVFSADRAEGGTATVSSDSEGVAPASIGREPEQEPEPEPEPEHGPEPAPEATPPAVQAERPPATPPEPAAFPAPVDVAAVNGPSVAPASPSTPTQRDDEGPPPVRKRRFWVFGRR